MTKTQNPDSTRLLACHQHPMQKTHKANHHAPPRPPARAQHPATAATDTESLLSGNRAQQHADGCRARGWPARPVTQLASVRGPWWIHPHNLSAHPSTWDNSLRTSQDSYSPQDRASSGAGPHKLPSRLGHQAAVRTAASRGRYRPTAGQPCRRGRSRHPGTETAGAGACGSHGPHRAWRAVTPAQQPQPGSHPAYIENAYRIRDPSRM